MKRLFFVLGSLLLVGKMFGAGRRRQEHCGHHGHHGHEPHRGTGRHRPIYRDF